MTSLQRSFVFLVLPSRSNQTNILSVRKECWNFFCDQTDLHCPPKGQPQCPGYDPTLAWPNQCDFVTDDTTVRCAAGTLNAVTYYMFCLD